MTAVGQGYAVIGKEYPRIDGLKKAAGQCPYADDLRFPGALVCRMVRSPRVHARIRSIDTREAERLPGVRAVLTGKDLPVSYGILPRGEDEHGLAQDRVRYVGEAVAAVAADDEWIAEEACRRIRVEYEDLEPYMSVEEALTRPGEPIHRTSRGANVHRVVALEFGDVEAGLRDAEYVREDLFHYEGSTHLPLETHAAVAVPEDGGRLTLYTTTQNPLYLHRLLARVLQMPANRIRVVATPSGGGFGGKCDLFQHEVAVCKLALVTGRPCRVTLSREEVFYTHRGRHPMLMWVRSGWKRDGTLTALHFRAFLDGGAYSSYGAATTYYAGALQPVTYRVPAYRFEAVRVFTNKPPSGPKRGHGTPQPRFALEAHLDRVAEDLQVDPVSLRKKNLIQPFSWTVNHLRVTSCGLERCLEAVVQASGFLERHGRLPYGQGLGLAVSGFMCGAGTAIHWGELDHSQVWVTCDRNGTVSLFTQATEIGQGSHTVHAAIVAEVLGLLPEEIVVVAGDTSITPVDLGSYSSRVTFMSGVAALRAAQRVRGRIAEAVAARWGVEEAALEFRDGQVRALDGSGRSMAFMEACQLAEEAHGPLVGVGAYRPPRFPDRYRGSTIGPSPAYSYSAAVVEVECDPETGWVTPKKVWVAHDIGRAIHATLARGQIEGCVYMALGEALMEEQAFRKGLHRGPSMLDYKSPTFLEMPPVETFLIESDDPEGPFGAKEAGQGPLLPVVPALANAVYDALGVRIDEVPITPSKVLRALEEKAAGRAGRYGPRRLPPFQWPEPVKVEPPAGEREGDSGALVAERAGHR